MDRPFVRGNDAASAHPRAAPTTALGLRRTTEPGGARTPAQRGPYWRPVGVSVCGRAPAPHDLASLAIARNCRPRDAGKRGLELWERRGESHLRNVSQARSTQGPNLACLGDDVVPAGMSSGPENTAPRRPRPCFPHPGDKKPPDDPRGVRQLPREDEKLELERKSARVAATAAPREKIAWLCRGARLLRRCDAPFSRVGPERRGARV
jgi:hypothetical protein